MRKVYFAAMMNIIFLVCQIQIGPLFAAESKTALVIGNGAYASSPLKNPVNDATDVASALEDLGFKVIRLIDGDRKDMREAVRVFGEQIRGGAVGLFFYAGHGLQVDGQNYLVPIGADVQSEDEVEDECILVSAVLRKMEGAGTGLNIIILDACRDNPFARSYRSSVRGLAQMDAPTGSILAYATSPGSVAADGGGRNGLYTSVLLKYLKEPDLEIGPLFRKVRVDVVAMSQQKQTPWESSSLMGEFYFQQSRGLSVTAHGTGGLQRDPYPGKLLLSLNPANSTVVFSEPGLIYSASMAIAPGLYTITVSGQGYRPETRQIRIEPGQLHTANVNLKKLQNLVEDPMFQNFGDKNGPWGTGAYSQHGIWWNSMNAKSTAKRISVMPSEYVYRHLGFQTALFITNATKSGPNLYGTTAQKIRVRPNTRYLFSMWAATEELRSNGALTIIVDPTWVKRLIRLTAGTSSWKQYTGEFNSNDASFIDLRIVLEDQGKVWLTGLTIYEASD